jgi:hypothetical protein
LKEKALAMMLCGLEGKGGNCDAKRSRGSGDAVPELIWLFVAANGWTDMD